MRAPDRIEFSVFLEAPLRGQLLDEVQQTIRRLAPHWSQRVTAGPEAQAVVTSVDLSRVGSLGDALRAERDRLDRQDLVGSGASEWFLGATKDFELLVESHAALLKRRGSAFANGVTLIVHRSTVEGTPSPQWLSDLARALCESLPIAYGFGRTSAEFAASNKTSRDSRGTPRGLDIRSHLPGLYWLNCLGKPYADAIGRERLRTVPAWSVTECESTVVFALDASPWNWRSSEYLERRSRCLAHLGPEFFFDIAKPDQASRVPTEIRTWAATSGGETNS